MIPIGERELETLLLAVVEGERIKPTQVAKREVFPRYGLLGSPKDRVLTALFYSIARKLGLLDKAIERLAEVRVE